MAAAPTFTPPGGAYTASQSVTLATTTPNATIFYTTDGTNPTGSSQVYTPGSPIAVGANTTIRALARAAGFADSPVSFAVYTITIAAGTVQPVVFSPGAGTQNNDFLLSLTTATPNATICYTTDGSVPGCSPGACPGTATQYNAGAQVRISGATTSIATGQEKVQAVACTAGSTTSAPVSQTYTLQVATPVFQGPAPGTLPFGTTTLTPTGSTATVGASALFTTDPANPPSCTNGRSVGLPGQFQVPPTSGSQEVLLVGCKPGYAPSAVATETYTFQLNAPTFTPPGGATFASNQTVTVNDDNAPNTWICATTDGSQPTCTATACTTGNGRTGRLNSGATLPVTATGTLLSAIACSGANPTFTDSAVSTSGVYTLRLDPVTFAPVSGTPIPAGGTLNVTVSQNNPGSDQPYDFICYTTNGTTVPDCTCTGPGQTLAAGTTAAVAPTPGPNATTVQAVGCLNANNTNHYVPSPVATASYPPAGATAAPTIGPAATTQNNDTQITFVNNDPVATVTVCYTTDGTTPACNNILPGICTSGFSAGPAAPGATVNGSGPLVSATATTVNALACDVSGTKAPSAPVTPAPVYTLQVADATISPGSGPLGLGAPVTFSSATAATVFHFAIDGSTPNCATSSQLGSNPTVSGNPPTSGPPFTATYTFTGQEIGGTVRVIACRPGYTQSPTVASATYTPTLPAPTFTFGTGTYDDTLTEVVTLLPTLLPNEWLCVGPRGGCGASVNLCTGSTVFAGLPDSIPVTNSGTTLTAVACAQPVPGVAVIASASASATYTLQTSGILFAPAAGAQTGTMNVTVSLLPSTERPQGDPAIPVSGVTSGTEICVSTTQSAPPQPVPCGTFNPNPGNLPVAPWTCATGGGSSGLGAGVSPVLTFSDVGVNTTFNAFTCRDGFVNQTGSSAYTFTAYSHTIAMTGSVADFNTGAEQIIATDGASADVSWDATNLYIGFDKGAPNFFVGSDYVQFYVGGATGGTQTPDPLNPNILSPQGLPPNEHALFHVWWKVDNSDTGIDQFTGAANGAAAGWVTTTSVPTVKFNQGSTFVEFSIPRATIGSLTDLHLVGGLWNGANFGSWPLAPAAGTPTTDTAWTNYQRELLNDAFVPNDSTQLNATP